MKTAALVMFLLALAAPVGAECVRSTPTLHVAEGPLYVKAGQTLDVRVGIKNLDSLDCAPRQFYFQSLSPGGGGSGDYEPNPSMQSIGPYSVTIAPGGYGLKTYRVTLAEDVSVPAYWYLTVVVGGAFATTKLELEGPPVCFEPERLRAICKALGCYDTDNGGGYGDGYRGDTTE